MSEQTEDAIYRELGQFVVTFQWLQNALVQLASFGKDPEHRGHGRRDVSNLWFRELVDATETSAGAFLDEHRGKGAEPEFRERLRALLVRCRDLARDRNRIIHSTYLFLEAGGELAGILRSDMRKGAEPNDVELDQEWLAEGSLDAAMQEIAEVGFEIGQCRLQLIHWYRPKDDLPAP